MHRPDDRRTRLLARIDAEWTAFNDSYAGLSDAVLIRPGVMGEWSIKDIIAHVTIWDEEAIKHLPLIASGGRPPRYSVTYGGIDAFNARMVGQRREIPLAEIVRQRDASHAKLLALIEQAPDDQLSSESRFRRRIRLDTYGHYPIHTAAILAWRDENGLDAPILRGLV